MVKPTGYILYEGPSMLDGAPIVAVATVKPSKNEKTGAMVQTWIMRADVAPTDALKTGDDSSVCGACPHRPINGGACYVTVFQAPLSVWKAYKRGRYADARYAGDAVAVGEGRAVRIGSYGDPAAVPAAIWRRVTHRAMTVTGYTHQWRNAVADELRSLCMASCDTEADREEARAAGWRTFRVRLDIEPKLAGEVVCPASAEGGHKLACAACGHCNGQATGRKSDVVIIAHGAISKVRAFVAFRTPPAQPLTA